MAKVKSDLENRLEKKVGEVVEVKKSLAYAPGITTDYKIQLDEVSKLKTVFTITIGGSYLDQTLQDFIKGQFNREKPSIQGFMKNKVPPMAVLVDHYISKFKKGTYDGFNNLFDFVLVNEVRRGVDLAKEEHGLTETLDPKFLDLSVREDIGQERANYKYKDYTFKFSLESLPVLPELDLSKLSVDTPKIVISDQDVKKEMENWAAHNSRGVSTAKPRAVKAGDTVLVKMSIPGKKEALDNFKVVVGQGKLNPEFETNLIGKNAGDKFEYNFGLPGDFEDASLAGRSYNVSVFVQEVQDTVPYQIDEEMAKVFGASSVKECEEKFRKQLEERVADLSFFAAKTNLKAVVGNSYDVLVPEQAFDEHMFKRLDKLAKLVGSNLHYPITDEEKKNIADKMQELFGYGYDKWESNESVDINKEIKASMMIMDYARKKNINVSNADVDQRVAQEAGQFRGGLKEAVAYFDQNPKAKQKLAKEVLDEKIIKAMLREVKTVEKDVSIHEFNTKIFAGYNVNPTLQEKEYVKDGGSKKQASSIIDKSKSTEIKKPTKVAASKTKDIAAKTTKKTPKNKA